MAVILNIETATSVCSVAVSKNAEVLSLEESKKSNVHAEKLTLFIESAIKKAGITLSQIDALAVGSGPGSYTGLRIGTSTVKGLCYGLSRPLIAISTLKAMADAASKTQNADMLFCPMIDARRLEVYTALYDSKGTEVLPIHAKVLEANSFAEYYGKKDIAFCGDGMPKMKKLLGGVKNVHWLDDIYASARNIASLAEMAFNKGEFTNLAYYEPFYLKDFVAKKSQRSHF